MNDTAESEIVYVWIVDGEKVRNMWKTDFDLSGHAYIYPWIPENEVWIEDQSPTEERPYLLLHELVERRLMKHEFLDYNDAHAHASKVEFAARRKYEGSGKKSFGDDFYAKGNLFGLEDLKTKPDRGLSGQASGNSMLKTDIKSVRGAEPPVEAEREPPKHAEPPPARRQSVHAPTVAPAPTTTQQAKKPPNGNVSVRHKPTVPSPEQAPRTPETPPPALSGTEPTLTPAGRQVGPKPRAENAEHTQSQVMGNVPTVHQEKVPMGQERPARITQQPTGWESIGAPLESSVPPSAGQQEVLDAATRHRQAVEQEASREGTRINVLGNEGREIYIDPIASGTDEEMQRRTRNTPLPLPDNGDKEVQKRVGRAWDVVSRFWPEISSQLKVARMATPEEMQASSQLRSGTAAIKISTGELIVPPSTSEVPPEILWHELVHLEQMHRGELGKSPHYDQTGMTEHGRRMESEAHQRGNMQASDLFRRYGEAQATADAPAEQHTTEEEQAGVNEEPSNGNVSVTPNVNEIRQDVRAASESPVAERHEGRTSRSSWLLDELTDILSGAQSDAEVNRAVSTFEESEEGFLTAAESDYIRQAMSAPSSTISAQTAERFLRGIGGGKGVITPTALHPSPAPKPRVFAYGGRKADEEQTDQAKRDVGRFLKKQYPEALFAAVGNGVDDGEVEVYYNNYVGAVNWEKPGKGSVEVITRGSGVHAKRIIGRNNGQLVIKNSIFKIEKDSPYKGSGFEFFVNQVAALQKMGVTKIYTHAAGKPNDPDGYNGYYTWPRMGYDGTIQRKVLETMPADLRQQLGTSRSVFDLFSLPGGKEWWNKNGADIVDAFFDLTPGSRNLKRLEEYQAERRNKGK